MNTTKITSDTISEKPRLIRFGFLYFMMRPLTLSQIWEIGSLLEGVEAKEWEGNVNVVAEMLQQKENAKQLEKVVVTMMFRSSACRFLFGWFVRKHLTMKHYQQLMEYYLSTLRAAFFLISITSLKGIKRITKQTNTSEATALGDSSEG